MSRAIALWSAAGLSLLLTLVLGAVLLRPVLSDATPEQSNAITETSNGESDGVIWSDMSWDEDSDDAWDDDDDLHDSEDGDEGENHDEEREDD
jgi:hypothetical protein